MRNTAAEWRVSSLGDLADIAIGGTPPRDIERYWAKGHQDGFPWVAISDIHDRVISETKEQITAEGIRNSNVKPVSKGTVLMSFKLSLGRVAFAGCDLFTNEAIAAFKTRGAIADEYLFYVLPESVRKTATDVAIKGATLNKESLRAIRIPYPNLPDQKKIATVLSSIDAAIEKTEALIEKYQQIKAGLMHDLFTRGVLPNGQLRPPREQAPELYQRTPIGWIPTEWKRQSVSLVIESIADGPFGSNLKTEHYVVDPGVRVVRLQNVAEYEYNDADKAFVSDRHAAYLLRNKVIAGDVLIAGLGEERYPVGRACCYPGDLPPAINKADCFRARCRSDVMENKFFMLFLNSELARKQIRRYEQGVTRPRINTGNLKRIDVCIPEIGEQHKIVAKFEAIQSSLRVQQESAEKLRLQKGGLMQDLLTGKVPVTVGAGEMANG